MAENECPNFAGLFTTKVVKSHVKLHVKSDAQKVNCSDPVYLGKGVCKRGLISAPKLLLLMNVTKLMGSLYDSVLTELRSFNY